MRSESRGSAGLPIHLQPLEMAKTLDRLLLFPGREERFGCLPTVRASVKEDVSARAGLASHQVEQAAIGQPAVLCAHCVGLRKLAQMKQRDRIDDGQQPRIAEIDVTEIGQI